MACYLALHAGATSHLLPSIIAIARKAPSAGSTVVINILLGWTLAGWATGGVTVTSRIAAGWVCHSTWRTPMHVPRLRQLPDDGLEGLEGLE